MKYKYRITIYNSISEKKKRVTVEAMSFMNAVERANWQYVRHASEEIIKAEFKGK